MEPTLPPLLPSGAAAILRGTCRALVAADMAVIGEFALANGRRADIAALDRNGLITIVEIKSSLVDFRTDRKWQDYLDYCDYFYFAVDAEFPAEVLPDEEGLIIADAFAAEIVRPAATRPLSAARRKAMLLRFGRTAAARLQYLLDPAAPSGMVD
jgi:hypothetical protein